MTNNIFYVVVEPNNANGLEVVSLIDFMQNGDCREIVKPGSLHECAAFFGEYTEDNKYQLPVAAQQEQISQARKFAGKDVAPKEYPLITNDVLTKEEKIDILNKSCQDAGFLLHASLAYTGERRSIEATVTCKTGEKYMLTFKKIE